MENPLYRSKSYFSGPNFATFRQKKKTLLDCGLAIYTKKYLKAKEEL
jgi:hypothetical protein